MDESAQLTLDEIRQPFYHALFRSSNSEIGAFGVTSSAIWAHGRFVATGTDKVYLLAEFANIDSLTLYYYDHGALKMIPSGSRMPLKDRILPIPGFAFEVPVAAGEPFEFWLRARTGNAAIIPLSIATEKGLPRVFAGMYVIELAYAGVVVALFLYNLSLCLWIRDRNYLYYLGYLFFLASFVLLYLRGFHVMLGETLSHFLNMYGICFAGASYLFAIPFSISFLKGRIYAPYATRALRALGIVAWAAIACSLAGWRPITIALQELISVVAPVLFIWMAIKAYRKKYKPAIYFLIAWTLLLASIASFAVINMRLLPMNNWYFHILPIGSAIEVVLLSLALGYRYALLEREKIALQQVNLQIVKEQNALLEQKVEERTQELKESNHVKDKLLSIISHDLRTPLNNLSGLLELDDMKKLSAGELKQFSLALRQKIKYITDSIYNILNWSLSQMDRIKTRPGKIPLQEMARQIIHTYRFTADQKNIRLYEAIPPETIVLADRHQLELVLRNLLDNAIKFTPQDGEIVLGCRPEKERVEIYVSDTGRGMTTSQAERLLQETSLYSTGGTRDEKGTGLGLQLCKEFVANNGGVLQIKSEPGKGTEFYFRLPGTA